MIEKLRSWLGPTLRWLAPSAVAACIGALAAGSFEGREGPGALGAAATAGFVAIGALPTLLVASALVRGLWAAWLPDRLAAALIDDDGAAPRLAGWVAALGLGALGLCAIVYQSVWLLALFTAFKPLPVSLVEPAVAMLAVIAIGSLTKPAARLFAAIAARLDARWRRSGRRTLLRPRIVLGAPLVLAAGGAYAVWRLLVAPAIGALDLSPVIAPALGVAAAIATHIAWPRLPRRALGIVAATIVAAAVAAAIAVPFAQPALTLEVWGDRPLAGLVIERLVPLETVRDRIPLAELRPVARPAAAHPDVILVTIDTVRADHTPMYGGKAQMPALRGLAERGAVFDWAFAPSNVTRRSIPSMVIGLAPNRVRGRVVGWALRVDPRHVLLAERLRAAGYDTAGFMCCEGFWGKEFHTGLERGLAHLAIESNGAKLAEQARAWIEAREQAPNRAPLFLWMHVLEPHNWTQNAGPDRNAAYDRSLTASDLMLQQIVDAFAGRADAAQPIIIVTADHGEALGEHGQPYHSTDLYNAQIRVPLVIAGPGIAARRVEETVSGTDLVPTVLDLAGFVPPSGAAIDGRSLADLATGARPGDPEGGVAFAAMIRDRSNPGGVTAVIQGRWKLIENRDRYELYDTRRDPDERTNVNGQHPSETGRLRGLLDAKKAAAAQSPFR